MVRVASDLDRFSVNHLYQKAAGIRTIIGANRSFNLSAQKTSWYNPKVIEATFKGQGDDTRISVS
jgi:response regulator RpfG family c-di-GMP phosphodiesterase